MSVRALSEPVFHWCAKRAFLGTVAAAALLPLPALADPIPPGGQASNLEVVGFTGLEGRPGAFKLAIKHAKNDHWYLYAGHSFDQGWSIIDVTDPKESALCEIHALFDDVEGGADSAAHAA